MGIQLTVMDLAGKINAIPAKMKLDSKAKAKAQKDALAKVEKDKEDALAKVEEERKEKLVLKEKELADLKAKDPNAKAKILSIEKEIAILKK